MTKRELAEEVMFSLNANYIRPECCVFCGGGVLNWQAAAVNPRGERKGVCGRHHAPHIGRNPWKDTLDKIKKGDFD